MKLDEALGIDLTDIDRTLRHVIESDPDLLSTSITYEQVMRLIGAGGKRLRPIMAIVGSRFGETGMSDTVLRTAAMLEYMHTASLIHDDIIDGSSMRRGVPTLHMVTDVPTAVHIANYMMARALEWASGAAWDAAAAAEEDNAYHYVQLASMTMELCLGEYGQLRNRFNYDLKMEKYLAKTRSKTALLMAHSLQAGGIAAHADEEICQLLYDFGEALGMAFQIKDDVLDFTVHAETLGKPVGADLRNGNITLPVLFALEDANLAPRIRSLHADSSDEEYTAVIQLINDSGATDKALQFAREYAARSRKLIDRMSALPASRDLHLLFDYFIQ